MLGQKTRFVCVEELLILLRRLNQRRLEVGRGVSTVYLSGARARRRGPPLVSCCLPSDAGQSAETCRNRTSSPRHTPCLSLGRTVSVNCVPSTGADEVYRIYDARGPSRGYIALNSNLAADRRQTTGVRLLFDSHT